MFDKEAAANAANAAMIIFILIGASLIGAYLLLGRTRSYLMYFGLASFFIGMSVKAGGPLRILLLLLTVAAFVVAVIEGVTDSKSRMAQFREESEEREKAFGDYMQALAEQEEDADEKKVPAVSADLPIDDPRSPG
ncbi:MAG: hypothetical protein ACYDBB_19665 [Armatimonadota bacterium]